MPTEHKSKKANKRKSPSISIKNEPMEVQTLEHYIDDRVELVRQMFSSLKSKTLKTIVPEFLQNKSHEELQEICLEELIGISKKRLASIINATKCPTDTESSDSDVEKVEEHISLEEISSDSNDELCSKAKKRIKKNTIAKTTSQPSKESENGDEKKQYSVLELLELQARARAIRSQLALEPVTKIELDDSDEEIDESPQISTKKPDAESKTAKTKETEKKSNENVQIEKSRIPSETEFVAIEPSTRPVRLKRNFRQRQMNDDGNDEMEKPAETEATSSEAHSSLVSVSATTSESTQKEIIENKSQEKAIEPTTSSQQQQPNDDDIIPIISEPEILCISSSDSETETANLTNKNRKLYIKMPPIEKIDRPLTEDEIFLEKIKQKSIKLTIDKSIKSTSLNNDMVNTTASTSTAESSQAEDEPPEDGEILDDENENDVGSIIEDDEDENTQDSKQSIDPEREKKKKKDQSESDENNVETENSNETTTIKKNTEEDDDEDIIDLGKDEDLDFEIKENVSQVKSNDKLECRKTRSQANIVENQKDESWDSRWLKNNKINKVLATAKLANKVRSKIKEKKTKLSDEIQQQKELNDKNDMETTGSTAEQTNAMEISSNIEVGSVEHYKELLKNQ